jgi:TctA family transporter
MATFISGVLATIVTVPFLGLALIYYISLKLLQDNKRAMKLAADCSTILFIISVHFIVFEIWQQSYLWLILIVILSTAIGMAILQRSLYEDIDIVKLLKGTWRVNFLLFVLCYIVLFTYGLTAKIISSFA